MSAYEFELVAALRAAGASVSTAESCTGGLVAARITSVSGASEAFGYGAVTYCNEAKNKILGVKKKRWIPSARFPRKRLPKWPQAFAK